MYGLKQFLDQGHGQVFKFVGTGGGTSNRPQHNILNPKLQTPRPLNPKVPRSQNMVGLSPSPYTSRAEMYISGIWRLPWDHFVSRVWGLGLKVEISASEV